MGSATVQGALWGAHAEDWAFKAEPGTMPLWKAILDAADVGPGTELLDIGCGAGGLCVLAADRGASVSGMDASEALLNIARQRVPDGDFMLGDIEDPPFTEGSFDVVTATNSVQFADDQHRALSEARSLLRPDGKFAIGMWAEPERCQMSAIFVAVGNIGPQPPARAHGALSLATRENLISLVESADFKIVKEGEVECPFEFDNVEEAWLSVRSAGILEGLSRKLGENTLRSCVMPVLETFRKSDGSVRIVNWFRYLICD
jgi:SAM-dependent methyltransferase